MYNLIGAICTSHGTQEYIDALRDMWSTRANDAVKEFKEERVTYDGGVPKIPWKQATQIMFQQLAVMKRLHGG